MATMSAEGVAMKSRVVFVSLDSSFTIKNHFRAVAAKVDEFPGRFRNEILRPISLTTARGLSTCECGSFHICRGLAAESISNVNDFRQVRSHVRAQLSESIASIVPPSNGSPTRALTMSLYTHTHTPSVRRAGRDTFDITVCVREEMDPRAEANYSSRKARSLTLSAYTMCRTAQSASPAGYLWWESTVVRASGYALTAKESKPKPSHGTPRIQPLEPGVGRGIQLAEITEVESDLSSSAMHRVELGSIWKYSPSPTAP